MPLFTIAFRAYCYIDVEANTVDGAKEQARGRLIELPVPAAIGPDSSVFWNPEDVKGEPVNIQEWPDDSSCDCEQGIRIRPIPNDEIFIVERCDTCARYQDDFTAAEAAFREVWVTTYPGDGQERTYARDRRSV